MKNKIIPSRFLNVPKKIRKSEIARLYNLAKISSNTYGKIQGFYTLLFTIVG